MPDYICLHMDIKIAFKLITMTSSGITINIKVSEFVISINDEIRHPKR